MDEALIGKLKTGKDSDAWHLPDAGRRASACRRRSSASRKPTNNCLEVVGGVSTAFESEHELSKSVAMIVRATLVRIALLSTALGGLTGCDTVGGAVSSAGSSVGGFFSHSDPNAASLNRGAAPDAEQAALQVYRLVQPTG